MAIAAGCALPAAPIATPAAPERITIVASERGPHGAVLVAIDEHGDRRRELFPLPQHAASITRDTNPVISPDGRWVAFASSRGRSLDETSLWIAPLAGGTPVEVGSGPWIDAHPAWTFDGTALVFASTRDGAGFDLERGELAFAPTPHFTRVDRLTDGRDHEVTPAVARDGTIVFAAVADLGGGRVDSKLEVRAPDGAIRALTAGPADTTPAISPDGCTVAFARPVVRGSTADGELWTVPLGAPGCAASTGEARLVDLPLTDETGPVWSADGRYLFATSMLRGADGTPVFSSVIYLDLTAHPVVARLLEDHAGATARLTPALAPGGFDTAALAANPEYLPELARILAGPIEEAKQRLQAAP